MLKFIKDFILPIAMITGALAYKWVIHLSFLTPYLIFLMLLLTFCRISLKEIRFHPTHLWLLLIQLTVSIGAYFLLKPFNEILAQGAMLCILVPTASSAAVITGMLGGNVGLLTANVLFCNIAVAIAAPVYFSLASMGESMAFLQSVWYICQKVFPLLILPLFIATAINKWLPKVSRILLKKPKATFYLWVVALTIVTGITVDMMLNQGKDQYSTEWGLLIISLILCCLQFFAGRYIGKLYGKTVSVGQALGQKNTILAIWMAQTYLHPLTAIAPAGYIIWQNIINSYLLYKKEKNTTNATSE